MRGLSPLVFLCKLHYTNRNLRCSIGRGRAAESDRLERRLIVLWICIYHP